MDAIFNEEMPRARLAVLLEHFSQIDDDREPWRVVYPLAEVLLLLTCCRATAVATAPRTWPSCAASRLASFAPTKANEASKPEEKQPVGTQTISSSCSNLASSSIKTFAEAACYRPTPHIRFTPLSKGNGDQKCLIQSVLLNKRLPNRLPKYRYQNCRRTNSVSAIASYQANGNLLIGAALQQRIRTDTIKPPSAHLRSGIVAVPLNVDNEFVTELPRGQSRPRHLRFHGRPDLSQEEIHA